MKLDLNFIIKGLDGEPMKGDMERIHAGMLIGNVLGFSSAQSDLSPMKRFTLAQALYKKMPVEVDKEESRKIKELISKPESGLAIITIAQVTEVIDNLTD